MWSSEFDLIALMSPFQLRIFYDSMHLFFHDPNVWIDSCVSCYLYFMAHSDIFNIESANACAEKLYFFRSVIIFLCAFW